ncbi:DUF2946 family protein [Bradyrhizobium ontarionense]|uniref:DUF2946 family protein n=1 Tax=Bradyrhizobium ontarionense TaxID=2898149 RepID=A0ABY3R743_9BRAD|nr:DUF2946 family protein [Bradyrhizobium sp. A19]UFZ02730.1 DUF2946 family protein [Bradyrhizobium sp. A19]
MSGRAKGRCPPVCRRGTTILAWLVAYALLWQALAASLGAVAGLEPEQTWMAGAICSSTADGNGAEPHGQPAKPGADHGAACCILCLSPSLAAGGVCSTAFLPVRIGIQLRPDGGSPVTELAAIVHPGQPRAPPHPT